MKFINDIASIEIIENNILHAIYFTKEMNLEIAKEALEFRLEHFKNEEYKIIIDASAIKKVSKDARDFMGSAVGYKGILASAIIIDSPLGAMLANFYMKFSTQPVPTRLFSNLEDAKKWLKSV